MNVARSVADVLAERVAFEVECIDRMYCNVYLPRQVLKEGRPPRQTWPSWNKP
jgi:hypothetical protein